eukprot:9971192-Ditylum_brightwellii.AAC.1
MPGRKKASGRGAAYTTAEKRFLVPNVSIVLPILELGWDKVRGMHIELYGAKNRTVESLRCCFTNMHLTKATSGDPAIAQEIREAKMAWLQICTKSECRTGSSEESASESKNKGDEDDVELQELLAPQMAQTIPSLSRKKKVIELDKDELSKSDSELSAFEEKSFKRLKKESVAKPLAKKSTKAVADKTELLSVTSSVLMSEKKKLMKQAKKTLEGKTISYPCAFKKPDSIETSMLCLLQ